MGTGPLGLRLPGCSPKACLRTALTAQAAREARAAGVLCATNTEEAAVRYDCRSSLQGRVKRTPLSLGVIVCSHSAPPRLHRQGE
ncbi:hypothetical protein NDU88_002401 [Pleurodeles waltl]|uniref:Uncharacterized protein n=1 Tax=Pleurodeles waltl TaxID=8319 RepID=A0AAV7UWX9_PLEWA|nr:hypothetical protein NDU88_002401 [Pleurodeles waltl]